MLYKLHGHILVASIEIGVHKYIFFGERILPKYHTCDVGLSNSMARTIKLTSVQQGFPSKPLA